MKPLKIGITGVRGIVGETFTPEGPYLSTLLVIGSGRST